ncbi:hypothetical protein B0H10DRAFT_1953342 [Mycena sp. CBHHK59/15]|nr:hypothetical protein B0H10DRAFT_1953342 [Mycena sp. CBHHK59/15]
MPVLVEERDTPRILAPSLIEAATSAPKKTLAKAPKKKKAVWRPAGAVKDATPASASPEVDEDIADPAGYEDVEQGTGWVDGNKEPHWDIDPALLDASDRIRLEII